MKLYAFDSFRGLPRGEGIDVHAQWKEGARAIGITECIKKIEKMGVDLCDRVTRENREKNLKLSLELFKS